MTTTCNVPGGCALYDNIVCIDMEFLRYKSNFRSEAYAGSCQFMPVHASERVFPGSLGPLISLGASLLPKLPPK